MDFCSPFDERLAHHGPGAVFLPDPEGLLRLAPNWTRTAWDHAEGEDAGWRWVLVRDEATGFVQLVLVTEARLLARHPRGQVRRFERLEDALAARAVYGSPPLCRDPW